MPKGCQSDMGSTRNIDGKRYYKHYHCSTKSNARKAAASLKKRVMNVVPPKSYKLKCSVRVISEAGGYGVWMWRTYPHGTKRGKF